MSKSQSFLIRDNFIEKATYIARIAPAMYVDEYDDIALVDCGLPADTFNVLIPKTNNPDRLHSVLARKVSYFNQKNYPMSLWVWEDTYAESLYPLIRNMGLTGDEVNLGMVAALDERPPANRAIEDFTIHRVRQPEDYHLFADVLATLFGSSPEAQQVRRYYEIVGSLQRPDDSLQLYLGRYGGQVVSTGAIFYGAESAGIYDIATREGMRGRGFGSAMFQHLLNRIRESPARTAVLQASPDGIDIYKRAGFQEVCTVQVFENRHLLTILG
ncbi:GNAT family N-acetyltransferase [Nibrella viscosa]|uniref:GNAT family N-acetyltransferase n=1 Tax=Nibrella viscosa TaxID=1084524 RepID=A0ABP8KPP7_9BACT